MLTRDFFGIAGMLLTVADCKLVIISADETMVDQLRVTGVAATVGEDNLYTSDRWLGKTVNRAWADAQAWIGPTVDFRVKRPYSNQRTFVSFKGCPWEWSFRPSMRRRRLVSFSTACPNVLVNTT